MSRKYFDHLKIISCQTTVLWND